MARPFWWGAGCAKLVLALGVSCLTGGAFGQVPDAKPIDGDTPYDRVYWARPHNTYLRKDYPTLVSVLERGNRVIELDVYPPQKGATNPRFVVKHDPGPSDGTDVNNCKNGAGGYLEDCLADIRQWILAHPNDGPVTIQIDMKAASYFLRWEDAELRGLQAVAEESLAGVDIVTPDEVRLFTTYGSLREGVFHRGWPSIGALRGRVVLQMMGGPIGDKNDTQERYIRLVGKPTFFVCPNAESPADFDWNGHAHDFDDPGPNSWVVCGNIARGKYWYEKTERSLRNRQLSNLWDGDANYFARFNHMYLAVGWGASMISRDDTETWGGKLPLNAARGSVPTLFKLRSRAWGWCAGLQGFVTNPKNGTRIMTASCDHPTNPMTWLYSDETQLRSRVDTKYCFDIAGGSSASEGAGIHLWDCDGGSSEKWDLRPDGSLIGMSGRCATMENGNDLQLRWRTCNGGAGQFFDIVGNAAATRRLDLPIRRRR